MTIFSSSSASHVECIATTTHHSHTDVYSQDVPPFGCTFLPSSMWYRVKARNQRGDGAYSDWRECVIIEKSKSLQPQLAEDLQNSFLSRLHKVYDANNNTTVNDFIIEPPSNANINYVALTQNHDELNASEMQGARDDDISIQQWLRRLERSCPMDQCNEATWASSVSLPGRGSGAGDMAVPKGDNGSNNLNDLIRQLDVSKSRKIDNKGKHDPDKSKNKAKSKVGSSNQLVIASPLATK